MGLYTSRQHVVASCSHLASCLPLANANRASMGCNWTAQPPSSQLSQVEGQEVVFNSSVRDPTPIPLQGDLDSQDNSAYNLKPFTATPPTSESIGSVFSSFQSAAPYGSQRVCTLHTLYNQ